MMRALLAALLLATAAMAPVQGQAGGGGDRLQLIDSFDTSVDAWRPEMQYGSVDGCKASRGTGVKGSGALRIDFDFRSQGTNHIVYARDLARDLSGAAGLSFEVKGAGGNAKVFLFLWDSKGQHVAYGPHGSNRDFYTSYPDWHRCRLSFELDRPAEGGDVDIGSIRRIGIMLNQNGVKKGTVWIDNLAIEDVHASLQTEPNQISPNEDGVRDALQITVSAPTGTAVKVEVRDSAGKLLSVLAEDVDLDMRRSELTWDGQGKIGAVPNGTYTIKAIFKGVENAQFTQKVIVDTSHKWPPLRYSAKPFFPIGVWFEGNPKWGGYAATPAAAKQYYDRCFVDLVAHGFNTVVAPNCPESLWETLLQCAQKRGIKVVLEISSLVALVGPEPITESQVYSAAKRVYTKLGKYSSLVRYQIRDEPASALVPNWLLVQRILGAVDPTRPAFSCFCSSGSLTAVANATKLSEAVFDIYPLGAGAPQQTLGGFLAALDAFSEAARSNTPWPVLQAFAKPDAWRYPKPEELRCMTYQALAAGAKGVFYFIYQSMPSHPEKLEGLVDPEGRATPMYACATQLAQEMRTLAPLLMSCKPGGSPPNVQADARAGAFTENRGRSVLIVASSRPDSPVTARFKADSDAPWKDALTGELLTPRDQVLEVPLGPGCGRVLFRG